MRTVSTVEDSRFLLSARPKIWAFDIPVVNFQSMMAVTYSNSDVYSYSTDKLALVEYNVVLFELLPSQTMRHFLADAPFPALLAIGHIRQLTMRYLLPT